MIFHLIFFIAHNLIKAQWKLVRYFYDFYGIQFLLMFINACKKGEVSVLKELVVYDETHINKQSPMYCNECSNKNMHKWQWQHRVIFLHEVEEISEIIEDNVEMVQNSALFQQNSAESAFQRRIRMCKDRGTCHS